MNEIRELLKLSVEERLKLVKVLWDSLPEDARNFPSISDELYAELERRMAEHEADPSTALDWKDVRNELWARVK
ncbi:MAG: addiction module protein [Rhizomicrobium sp.]